MSGSVLFIQGGGVGAYAADRALADSLQRALGSGWDLRYPAMPDEENCPYPAWKAEIDAQLAAMKGPVTLVGHSFGGSVLLKYLCEQPSPLRIAGLFLVAAPYWGPNGWSWDELNLPADAAMRLAGDWPLVLFHSRDDEVVPFSHLALYTAQLPRATVREVEGRDHQFGEDLADVAAEIVGTQSRAAPTE